MKNSLNFLIEINKLKEQPRTGWVLMKVKNPETIAEHIFRTAFATWMLCQKKKLNVKRALKITLAHDLCEVYAGDMTPFFYYIDLPKNGEPEEKALMKWVRLSKKEKERRGKIKFDKEKQSLSRLLKNLPPELKDDIFSSWIDYEKGISREGKFVRQLDRIEMLLQSIEYFGTDEKIGGSSWWEGTEERVEDPLLLNFLKVIQKKIYGKVNGPYKKDKELENILDFLLSVGKLKRLPRLYWTLRDRKEPETVAGHIFTLALMAWIFGRENNPKLNVEKFLKMALCHEISAVHTGDTTPYDRILAGNKAETKDIFKKMVRLSREEKKKTFLKDFSEEKRAVEKLVSKLNPALRKEIVGLWQEYRTRVSPESHFLAQLNAIAVLLQGLLYKEKDKNFSVNALWEWVLEGSDNPVNLKLINEIKERFYS